jgi:hypothetical protein
MEKLVSPRETEINYLLECARLIIDPEKAETVARILTAERPGQGKGLDEIGIRPRPMRQFYRANYTHPDLPGVAVHELAIAIAIALGEKAPSGDWYASPFMGTGRNAELWTRRAVAAIQRHYGFPPVDELN